jgi:hypothetical protein
VSIGSATPHWLTRLRVGSLSLQPAGLLGSLIEPLSENLMFRIAPNIFLKLRGELPNSHGRTLTDKSFVIHGIRTQYLILDVTLLDALR